MIRLLFLITFFLSSYLFAQETYIPINTGVNMTVAILDVDSLIAIGDTILAMYTEDDIFRTGGFTIWNGTKLAIALWGDDSTSDVKDGFIDGENIKWIIRKDNQNLELTPYYQLGTNHWQANGLAVIEHMQID